ncbi:MAG TPA: hypothetical protein VGO08_00540 [Burkholderiales bacterium]|nr:hypothetical protein [Burkholderiales bacterium]
MTVIAISIISTASVRLLAIPLVAALTACGSGGGWSGKALANEGAASAKVGGFSDADKRLYHRGVQHIANVHQHVGAFTIGQVVDQEREREAQRARSAEEARARREAARARARDAEARAPAVSAYAKGIALLIQLDAIASRDIVAHARAENLSAVYGTATQAASGAEMGLRLRGKMPDSFDRTQAAFDEYLAHMKQHYEAAAEMVNNPTPKTMYEFRATVGSDYGASFVAALFKAYDRDLEASGFAGTVRERLRSRIRGG